MDALLHRRLEDLLATAVESQDVEHVAALLHGLEELGSMIAEGTSDVEGHLTNLRRRRRPLPLGID